MLSDDATGAKWIFDEVVRKDCYELRALLETPPKMFVDIGANYGFFSVYARMLFPHARIVAVEPFAETFRGLQTNTEHLDIRCHQLALGDGQPIVHVNRLHSGCAYGKPTTSKDPGQVDTFRLPALLDKLGVTKTEGLFLKIDCEGGEHHIVGNHQCERLLDRVPYWSMEVHVRNLGPLDKRLSLPRCQQWIDKLKRHRVVTGAWSHEAVLLNVRGKAAGRSALERRDDG